MFVEKWISETFCHGVSISIIAIQEFGSGIGKDHSSNILRVFS